MRMLGLAATAAVVVTCLSSCWTAWPSPRDEPTSIKRDGTELVVTFCADVEADMFELLQTDPGVTPYLPSEPIRFTPHLLPGDQIAINGWVMIPEGGISVVSAEYQIGPDGLSDTMWQHPDGSLTAQPCETSADGTTP